MQNTNTFIALVPTDFSSVAECAVNHAAMIANSLNGEVHLLHIVPSAKKVEEARPKLEELSKNYSSQYGLPVKYILREGNIFEDIGDVAAEIGAGMIIMGTHGAKGMQKLTGSYAIKVISHSKVPFVIVQNKNAKGPYKKIVLPIKSALETKQKLGITASVANHFGSTVHIFLSKQSDEFLRVRVNQELQFAKHYFDEKKVSYEISISKETGSFIKQLLEYSKEIDADVIAIVNTTEGGNFLPSVFGSEEQEVIANKYEIPALITNPTQSFVAESFG